LSVLKWKKEENMYNYRKSGIQERKDFWEVESILAMDLTFCIDIVVYFEYEWEIKMDFDQH
jgi:hypothetical protein